LKSGSCRDVLTKTKRCCIFPQEGMPSLLGDLFEKTSGIAQNPQKQETMQKPIIHGR